MKEGGTLRPLLLEASLRFVCDGVVTLFLQSALETGKRPIMCIVDLLSQDKWIGSKVKASCTAKGGARQLSLRGRRYIIFILQFARQLHNHNLAMLTLFAILPVLFSFLTGVQVRVEWWNVSKWGSRPFN